MPQQEWWEEEHGCAGKGSGTPVVSTVPWPVASPAASSKESDRLLVRVVSSVLVIGL